MSEHPRCPRGAHKGWPNGIGLDRFTDGSGWECPGILPDGSDCGYRLGPALEPVPDLPLDVPDQVVKLHGHHGETIWAVARDGILRHRTTLARSVYRSREVQMSSMQCPSQQAQT